MNNSIRCTWCRQARSIFQFRPDSNELVCQVCAQIEQEAGEDVPVVTYRALGHLFGRIGHKTLREKTMAVVRHDRTLRGAA